MSTQLPSETIRLQAEQNSSPRFRKDIDCEAWINAIVAHLDSQAQE